MSLYSVPQPIINDLAGRGRSWFFKCVQTQAFFFLQNSNYIPVKGFKMSNNNQINTDRLACTINTADHGSSLL